MSLITSLSTPTVAAARQQLARLWANEDLILLLILGEAAAEQAYFQGIATKAEAIAGTYANSDRRGAWIQSDGILLPDDAVTVSVDGQDMELPSRDDLTGGDDEVVLVSLYPDRTVAYRVKHDQARYQHYIRTAFSKANPRVR